MADVNAINVGIITENDAVGFHLEKLLISGKYFRILTVKRNCAENYSQVKHLLTEWCKKKIELILVVGCTVTDESMLEVSQNLKEDMPHLAMLVSLKSEYRVFQSCHYYVKEKSLIVRMALSLDNCELYFEKLAAGLLNAVKEIQTKSSPSSLSFQKSTISGNKTSAQFIYFLQQHALAKNSQASMSYLCKSNVQLGKLAERPRKSVYEMISVSKAVEDILEESLPLGIEYKNYRDSHMFVLAENVIAEEPYPSFPASIKDGYAVIAEDDSKFRKVIGAATPGYKPDCTLVKGTCIRVSTGSVIPDGANAVIQVEDTLVAEKDGKGEELMIEVLKFPHVQQDIRAVGSDVAKGEILIPANTKILATEIGIMSICGIQKALVYRKPWIALLSTGDEVVEPEMPLKPGCIRDSNKSTLMHMIIENKIPVIDIGIARDTPDDIKSHLMLAFEAADIIISTGGVSMGERDMLKLVLEQDFGAKIHFGRIHMKPGKPTTFSTVVFEDKKKIVFSLPGNPVSAFVCFYLFVIPCIKKMIGFKQPRHVTIKVELSEDLQLDERPEFQRVYLSSTPDGTFLAHSTGAQQSSRLLSMQNADALLVLPPRKSEQSVFKKGSKVDAILLTSIFGSILK